MIQNLAEAVAYYNKEILNGEGGITQTFNGTKGPIAKRLHHFGNAYNHVVFFKKSWNEYFGSKFRKPEQRGQTCRLSILEEASAYGEVIGVVHPNYEVYTCMAQDWLSYARKNGTIWIPKGEEHEEASVPASMLMPMKHRATELFRITSEEEYLADREKAKNKIEGKSVLDEWM